MRQSPPVQTISSNDSAKLPISKWEMVLFPLACFGMMMPPAYLAIVQGLMLFTFLWSVWERRRLKGSAGNVAGESSAAYEEHQVFLRVRRWLMTGMIAIICTGVIAWIGHALIGSPGLNLLKEAGAILNQWGKQAVYGCLLLVISWSAYRRGYDFTSLVPPLFWFLTAYIGYMLFQRYTGIDWIKGWGATLPPNRFAYGVYRSNGLIAHPLTLGYNLMLISLVGFHFSRHYATSTRWYGFGILGLAIFGQLLSGSRWPLAVSALMMAAPVMQYLWRYKMVGVLMVFVGVTFLKWEGQMLGRMSEITHSDQNWEEKIPRLVFWKIHGLIFMDHTMIGSGISRRQAVAVDYYNRHGYTGREDKYLAHNSFLQVLADSGVVGFLGILALLAKFGQVAWLWWNRYRTGVLFQVLGATLLAGLMQNNLHDTEFLYAFWFAAVLIVVSSMVGHLNQGGNVAGNNH